MSPPPAPPPQLQSLAQEKASLLEKWEERRGQFDQCMELQLFMRDAEQVDTWMGKQEVREGGRGGEGRRGGEGERVIFIRCLCRTIP